ncbi:hypothetical protein JCM16358_08300 [Halanaerocella petrolearia]
MSILVPNKEDFNKVYGNLNNVNSVAAKCACVACNSCTCACSCRITDNCELPW